MPVEAQDKHWRNWLNKHILIRQKDRHEEDEKRVGPTKNSESQSDRARDNSDSQLTEATGTGSDFKGTEIPQSKAHPR